MLRPEDHPEVERLAGAIVIKWNDVDNQVSVACIQLEAVLGKQLNIAEPHNNLEALRDFKRRRGYLRALVQAYGKGPDLAALDRAYKKIAGVADLRHGICHDIIIASTRPDKTTIDVMCCPLINHATKVHKEPRKYAIADLASANADLKEAWEVIFGVLANVASQIIDSPPSEHDPKKFVRVKRPTKPFKGFIGRCRDVVRTLPFMFWRK